MKNFIKEVSISICSISFAITAISSVAIAQNVKDISFISLKDATQQHYVEITPKSYNKKDSVNIVFGLHGHGSDRWQFAKDKRPECLAFRNFAAAHNMIAVTPDYRAKTSWMGPAAAADMVQIIEILKKKYPVRHVYLVGASMGGTSALTFSVLHPQLINGVTSMNAHANHLEYKSFQEAISESFGGSKDQIPDEYKKRSAEYWPEKLKMPIAFTVGVIDTIVPPNSIYRLVNILGNLNREVLLIVAGTAGHATSYDNAYMAMEHMIKVKK